MGRKKDAQILKLEQRVDNLANALQAECDRRKASNLIIFDCLKKIRDVITQMIEGR